MKKMYLIASVNTQNKIRTLSLEKLKYLLFLLKFRYYY